MGSTSGITQFSEYPAPADTLLFHISLSPSDPEREEIAKKFLRIARGNFRRIIILDHCRADEEIVWLRWITGSNLHHSYRVTGLDWSGGETGCSRNIIVALELKGLV